mmetsp:Transcript_6686/g.19658  ORF Transcript_6686/g.19658 Transcript_6686/m.19658 type:complete len:445 (-) Transcript_6686:23-1357(-)
MGGGASVTPIGGSRPRGVRDEGQPMTFDYKMTKEVLGTGMNGVVRTAVHQVTGAKVAVKSFRVDGMSPEELAKVAAEVEIHAMVDHPNVAHLSGVSRSRRHLRMLIEHLEGGDVFEHLISVVRLSEPEAAQLIQQVLQAVEYLHGKGIVHRDIKLENLVYESGRQDKVKLVDFGLCTFWKEGMDPMRRFCGTRTCLAPEVIRGAYTRKADMWCVGCAAYTLLTGENLMRNLELAPVYSPRFRHTSAEAQSFVTTLLAMDENLRLSAEEALKHSWICGAGSGEAALLESGRKTMPVAEASTWSGGIRQEDTASRFSTTSRVQLRGVIRHHPTEEGEEEREEDIQEESNRLHVILSGQEAGGTDGLQRAETSAWRPTLPGVTSLLASARRRLAAIFTTVRGSGPARARAQAKATARVAPQTAEVQREAEVHREVRGVRGVVPHYSA